MIEECAEAPDDDAPRMVFADAVGGERGELVVIQCQLARGGLTLPEVVARRQRERQLLERHGVAWAGSLASVARRWSFRRGFVEAAAFDRFDDTQLGWLSEHPLLDAITLPLPALRDVPRSVLGELRGLFLEAPTDDTSVLADLARRGLLRDLVAFGIADLEPAGAPAVLEVLERAALAQLWLPGHGLVDPSDLLAHARGVVALDLRMQRWNMALAPAAYEALRRLPLRALRIDRVDAASAPLVAALPQLEHLGARLEVPLDLPRLRTLELHGAEDSPGRFDGLRVLRVRGYPSGVPALLAAHGAHVELLDLRRQRPDASFRVAGEVLSDHPLDGDPQTPDAELLHRDPAAMFEIGLTCRSLEADAWLARVDRQRQIWPVPRDRPSFAGRVQDIDYRLDEDCISRRHARVAHAGASFTVEDLASTQGVVVDGTLVNQPTRLDDGAELVMGHVVLRFFSGEGARERARAAVRAAELVEPVTRLPRRASGAQLAVADWQDFVHRTWASDRVAALRQLVALLHERLGADASLAYVENARFSVEPREARARLLGTYHIVLDADRAFDLVVA